MCINANIMNYVSFRTCIKPLRKDHLTQISLLVGQKLYPYLSLVE